MSDLTASLVAQWYLNDTAGTTHCDDVSTNHDGVIADGVFASALTAVGKAEMTPCFDFDGQYAVTIADAATLSFGNGTTDSPFSISAWVYHASTTSNQMILSKANSGVSREWDFYINNSGRLSLTLTHTTVNAYVYAISSVMSVGWHFVTATYDGSSSETGINLYIDNALDNATRAQSGTYVAMTAGATDVLMGAWFASGVKGRFFADKIDNVILFDAEITSADVTFLWNSGSGTEELSPPGGAGIMTLNSGFWGGI